MITAYLDCFSGISGDMFIGALLDAGLGAEELKKSLDTLPLKGYHLRIKREKRHHISGTRFLVNLPDKKQVPRNLADIRNIIQRGDLSTPVKEKAIQIFTKLADIEGKIHSLPPEEIRFHEVGAVDSIIDIVGCLIGIECLGIGAIHVSHIPLGSGFMATDHGRIPIPAPATIELLKGIPVYDPGIKLEMVTPTGAALITCLSDSFGPMPPMVIQKIGYGVGQRDLPESPNLLRILIGEDRPDAETETVVLLETNLDDTNPEWLGFLMERLFDAGALDVAFVPIQMKKNRPGIQVQVMGRPDQKEVLMEILFRESATLGVRFRYAVRSIAGHSPETVDSPWGQIAVKKIALRNGGYFVQPEFEACRDIALQHDRPLREIYSWVLGLNK